MDSHEQEAQLLGAILRDGRTFQDVSNIVDASMFHNITYQDVYKAMRSVYEAGLTIDAVTVGDQLSRNEKLNDLRYDVHNGRMALSKMRELGLPKNVKSYALNVQDYHGKRRITEMATKFAEWSMNGRRATSIIADARKMFDELETSVGVGLSKSFSAGEAASLVYDMATKAAEGQINYYPTGTILDTWFRMRKKNLTIVAARPGQGKTAFLVTLALNYCKYMQTNNIKGKVWFGSMEMSVEEISARFISQLSNVPTSRILDGQMTAEDWPLFTESVAEYEALPLVISDVSSLSIQQIRTEAKLHFTEGDNMLIIDYLQLATSGNNKASRVDEVGTVARGLKVLAQDLDITVLAAAQLSRAIEQRQDKRPILSDLRESGNIEQDANNVLFLYQEEGDDYAVGSHALIELRKVIVAKQRNGATSYDKGKGDIQLNWNGPLMRFEDTALKTVKL